jgi:hypothetical protein
MGSEHKAAATDRNNGSRLPVRKHSGGKSRETVVCRRTEVQFLLRRLTGMMTVLEVGNRASCCDVGVVNDEEQSWSWTNEMFGVNKSNVGPGLALLLFVSGKCRMHYRLEVAYLES